MPEDVARGPLLVVPAQEYERHPVHGKLREAECEPEPPPAFVPAPQQEQAAQHEGYGEERPATVAQTLHGLMSQPGASSKELTVFDSNPPQTAAPAK